MALRKIICEGDPLLRKRSREVEEVTDRIRTLAEDMWETMYEAEGVGLAAPQVGVLRRIAVIDVTEPAEPEDDSSDGGTDPNPVPEPIKYLLINPELVEASEEMAASKEGCLSVPGKSGLVERPARVKVRALDIDGKPFEIEGEGMLAKALLHEIDHLNGILYTDIAEEIEDIESK
ncbi:MAG: peptide deformylase [Clostridiales bacterium]|nr:peptide deformylase [Clostridiales bacterium]